MNHPKADISHGSDRSAPFSLLDFSGVACSKGDIACWLGGKLAKIIRGKSQVGKWITGDPGQAEGRKVV